jgi:ATP phosphoribosyltransferase regulatory subunit
MAAETARKFEALEAQAQKIMQVFIKAGHEAVSPAIIQPAGVFLDVIGESLRARTYVFTDPDGDELCLRPDLTVPTCRLHIERHGATPAKARYCYNGPAFRFQPVGADSAHPREFRQAGIENIGAPERERADAQTVATVIEALRASGLKNFKLRIGDLGLFRALIKAIEMPDRWRQFLTHLFWRPEAFRAELARLSRPGAESLNAIPAVLRAAIDPSDLARSERAVLEYLSAKNIEIVGARSVTEVAANLMWRVADAKADPLPPETVSLIERYLTIAGPAKAAGASIKDLLRERGPVMSPVVDAYHRRLQLMADMGVDVVHAEFSAEFGRQLEYYTGFVFEIIAPGLGPASPVAGGGRYDDLMRIAGAAADVPAVGAAIHTERLLSVIQGGGA